MVDKQLPSSYAPATRKPDFAPPGQGGAGMVVGDLTVKVHCDTSELDVVLAKLDQLAGRVCKPEAIHDPGLGALLVGVALANQTSQPVSRRDLLFWWRR